MFALDKPFTWIIILVIILLIFGAGKLPEVGRSLGRSVKDFKVEAKNTFEDESLDTTRISTIRGDTDLNPKPMSRRKVINHSDRREEKTEKVISHR
jgi:TatA/E family protein of Tat protein translocase